MKQQRHTYPYDFELRIGFDKIRTLLLNECHNEVSLHLGSRLTFLPRGELLSRQHALLSEALSIQGVGVVEPYPLPPLKKHLKEFTPKGSTLSIEGLVAVRALLRATEKATTKQAVPEMATAPKIKNLLDSLRPLPKHLNQLEKTLTESGEISDNASPLLLEIRQKIASIQRSIGGVLQNILREAKEAGWVEKDAEPTLRNGRLLLPIIPSAKKELGGIVYEESATGKTLFVEPMRVVSMNNDIRSLQEDERSEINRILRELSTSLHPYLKSLQNNTTLLGALDFLCAKATLAYSQKAILPLIHTKTTSMEWIQARHPLLEQHLREQGRSLVPLDIRLSSRERLLLISGPNAGGKSATLKCVGLLQYMLQCGLAIPVGEGSHCTLFDKILLDIGDQQSLENDLSTYSSHLQNMKYFIREASHKTLILIDEFGGGTEPTIGGAIAEGVLSQLKEKGCYGVITTHYGNLKDYAEQNEGLVNGAMLFDRQKIEPLFLLHIGQPGSSFALEIARSIGLPTPVLEYAMELVGKDYMQQDKLLQDIMRDKAYWERKRTEVHKLEKNLQFKETKLDERLLSIHEKRENILAKAEQEALHIISSANAIVEKTIREIKTVKAEKEETKRIRSKLEAHKEQLKNKSHHTSVSSSPFKPLLPQEERQKQSPLKPKDLEIGSNVHIKDSNSVGEIIEIEKGKALVRLGNLTMWVSLQQLSSTDQKATVIKKSTPKIVEAQSDERKNNFSPQLDCRGMRADEALLKVTLYIDDAIRYGFSPIRILHGTGTGALRNAIREFLATNHRITSFHDEHVDFGGAGITIVHL